MAASFISMIAIGVASQAAKSSGYVHNQMKSFSTEGCPVRELLNATIANNSPDIPVSVPDSET